VGILVKACLGDVIKTETAATVFYIASNIPVLASMHPDKARKRVNCLNIFSWNRFKSQ
jgi:hypothetical protein